MAEWSRYSKRRPPSVLDQGRAQVRCAWAGDIHSSFPSMRRQVTAGIHMGVAGIPWFTTDIGGFGGGRIDDPAFHELLVRWFQMGTFMPVMRLHGDRGPSHEVLAADGSRRCNSGADNELWSYGDEVYEILSRYVHLREEMREYTRGLMEAAHVDGQPVMRGLFHDFPEDAAAWDVADQFLYGPSLLVAPVLEAGARTRRVYLPAGAAWTSLASGGGSTEGRGSTSRLRSTSSRCSLGTRRSRSWSASCRADGPQPT